MINPLVDYNRHRDSANLQALGSTSLTQRNYAGTIPDPWRITSTVVTPGTYSEGSEQDMYDVVTENFEYKKRHGEIINSPMERTVTVYRQGVMSVNRSCINRSGTSPNYYYSGYRQNGSSVIGNKDSNGTWPLPPEPQLSSLDNLIAEVVTDMWSKVSVKQNDTLASVGEMRETVSSLVSIFVRVIEIYRDIRKLRFDEVYRKTLSKKALAEYYMFYRYALRPLVFEAQNYVDVICNKTLLKRQTYRSFRTLDAEETYNNVTLFASSAGTLIGSQRATRNVEIRGGVLCTLDITNNLGRWGITEPLEGIWELIPFSFIIDWFFNIGKFIASWTPNFGITKLASWITVTDMVTLVSTVESGTNSPSYNYEDYRVVSGEYSKVIVRKYRLPEPSRPLIPTFSIHMDWLKSLDVAIILKQLLKCKW